MTKVLANKGENQEKKCVYLGYPVGIMGHKIFYSIKYIHEVKALGTGHWCM